MSKYNMKEGWLSVEIIYPSKEEVKSYYSNTGEIETSSQSDTSPRVFKKAIILNTFNEDIIPTNSVWIIGETPGMKVNFFGEKLILIKESDLYGRIN